MAARRRRNGGSFAVPDPCSLATASDCALGFRIDADAPGWQLLADADYVQSPVNTRQIDGLNLTLGSLETYCFTVAGAARSASPARSYRGGRGARQRSSRSSASPQYWPQEVALTTVHSNNAASTLSRRDSYAMETDGEIPWGVTCRGMVDGIAMVIHMERLASCVQSLPGQQQSGQVPE